MLEAQEEGLGVDVIDGRPQHVDVEVDCFFIELVLFGLFEVGLELLDLRNQLLKALLMKLLT